MKINKFITYFLILISFTNPIAVRSNYTNMIKTTSASVGVNYILYRLNKDAYLQNIRITKDSLYRIIPYVLITTDWKTVFGYKKENDGNNKILLAGGPILIGIGFEWVIGEGIKWTLTGLAAAGIAIGSYMAGTREGDLPDGGDYPFIPKKNGKEKKLKRNRDGDYIDERGRGWRWDPIKEEWDVQIDGGDDHVNVDSKGNITHPKPKPKKDNCDIYLECER